MILNFSVWDEKLPYDVILAETDPVAVKMEIESLLDCESRTRPPGIFPKTPGPFSAGAYQGYGYNAQTILY